jgi:RNA polymerase sigma-70 factor (ECF subfamily)
MVNEAQRRSEQLLLADEDLMSFVPHGDKEALGTLYDRHSRTAYSLAYRMMGERLVAEDLVQEAFLQVWRAAGSYRVERGSVRTWLLSIVRYRGIDHLRSSASRRRMQDRAEAVAPTSQPSEAFDQSWRNSQNEQVRAALRGLPLNQHSVLELAYFSGYTHIEIAELLELPLGTVKGRMRSGLKKLREYFESRGMAVARATSGT